MRLWSSDTCLADTYTPWSMYGPNMVNIGCVLIETTASNLGVRTVETIDFLYRFLQGFRPHPFSQWIYTFYDLNLTLGCHRFYYLAPLPVLDPIYLTNVFSLFYNGFCKMCKFIEKRGEVENLVKIGKENR
jgi:hypothetical protein